MTETVTVDEVVDEIQTSEHGSADVKHEVRDGRMVCVAEFTIYGGPLASENLTGHGASVCNPEDYWVQKIGEHIAVARAMGDFAAQLEERWSKRSVTKAEVEARRAKPAAEAR